MGNPLFDSILGNKLIRDFAFGKVKELIKEQNLECIKIFINDAGEIDATLVKKENTENNGTNAINATNG